jgi:hypothetical protein
MVGWMKDVRTDRGVRAGMRATLEIDRKLRSYGTDHIRALPHNGAQ